MALSIPTTSMATTTTTTTTAVISSILLLLLFLPTSYCSENYNSAIPVSDIDLLEFPLNLEYLEAEFFLWGSLGYGLDSIAPNLTMGGPPPVGTTKARLDPFTKDVILQFAFQEVGHLSDEGDGLVAVVVAMVVLVVGCGGRVVVRGGRAAEEVVGWAIKNTVRGFPRPLLNLSAEAFGNVMNSAFGRALKPAFDPYANELNFLLASYVIPYVGLTGYVGANPKLQSPISKRLVAGLLAVESGQDAVIRGLLYERAREKVKPYGITVAAFTDRISELRNKLGSAGVKDEGLIVPTFQGAEGKLRGNVLAGDQNSVGYDRTPEEILRIIYSSGDEHVPGGFYPKGADGVSGVTTGCSFSGSPYPASRGIALNPLFSKFLKLANVGVNKLHSLKYHVAQSNVMSMVLPLW
ncbi:hypothetical protein TEA_008605 [Camellia sinensis var. sinensis]|uniref:Desiccation-related protein PCC13-62 n=1 Tax=Camellia sinensis var. sinensis TaxID=542762 RepID=A0A4S4EJJ4_CAMSN|nr:hypothetical protein TEA_008605 [Camellia sinensis var. sinensis]